MFYAHTHPLTYLLIFFKTFFLGLREEVEEHIVVPETVMSIVFTKIIHHLMMKIIHGMVILLSRCESALVYCIALS